MYGPILATSAHPMAICPLTLTAGPHGHADWDSDVYHVTRATSLSGRVAPDIISGPAPAEIRPNFHIRPYPAGAGYGRWIRGRIWGRIWPSFDASASLCNWTGINCFTNSAICTSLFYHGHLDHTHILVSVCVSLLLHSYVMCCLLYTSDAADE